MTTEEEYRDLLHSIAEDLSSHPECQNLRDCQAFVMNEFSKCLNKLNDFAGNLVKVNQRLVSNDVINSSSVRNISRLSSAMDEASRIEHKMMDMCGYKRTHTQREYREVSRAIKEVDVIRLFPAHKAIRSEKQKAQIKDHYDKYIAKWQKSKSAKRKAHLKRMNQGHKHAKCKRAQREDGTNARIDAMMESRRKNPEEWRRRKQEGLQRYLEAKRKGPEALRQYRKEKEERDREMHRIYSLRCKERKRQQKDNDTELPSK